MGLGMGLGMGISGKRISQNLPQLCCCSVKSTEFLLLNRRWASTEKREKAMNRQLALEDQSASEQFVNLIMKDGKKGKCLSVREDCLEPVLNLIDILCSD